MGIAAWYLAKTPNQYTRSAQILIKSDSRSNSEFHAFSDISMLGGSSNVQSELATLRSPEIMERVVSRLGLETSYSTDGTFRRNVLYGSNLPIKVDFVAYRRIHWHDNQLRRQRRQFHHQRLL